MLRHLRVPILPGTIAILAGIAAPMLAPGLAASLPAPLAMAVDLLVVYLAAGFVMGLIWPGPSWIWGVWISLPMVLLILVSVAFTGQLGAFLRHDLLPMTAALAGGLGGGAAGAFARMNFSRSSGAEEPNASPGTGPDPRSP
jgi:hypothetical protein